MMSANVSALINTKLIRRLVALLSISSICCAVNAQAQNAGRAPLLIKVKVEAKPEPLKAVGLVFSATDSQQVLDTKIEKVGDTLYNISFSVDPASLSDDSVATAMAFNTAGDIIFANVTPALLSNAQSPLASIPDCPVEDPTFAAQLNQQGPLQQLVDIRTERTELVRIKISRILTPELLQSLSKFEEAFGLSRTEALSSTLPAAELVDRLSRLELALKKYKAFKKS